MQTKQTSIFAKKHLAAQSGDRRRNVENCLQTAAVICRRGVSAFYEGRSPAPSFVPHRAATARRSGQTLPRTPHKRQTVIVGCRGAGYLRACVALKPSGGAGLSKGQRGARRNAPIAPWKTTPLVAVSYLTKFQGCRGFNICQKRNIKSLQNNCFYQRPDNVHAFLWQNLKCTPPFKA